MKNPISGAPLGYHFNPTDVLRRVGVEKQPLTPPHDRDIHSYNMFGTESEPSEIWAAYGGPDLAGYSQGLYFFSEIKRVTPNGSYVVGKMGGGEGKWNGKVGAVRIDGDSGPIIGQKRSFGYLNKSSEDDGGWLLDEYSIFASPGSGVGRSGYDYNLMTGDFEVAQEETSCCDGTGNNAAEMEDDYNLMMGEFEDYDHSMCLCLADLDSICEEQEEDCGNIAAEEEQDWSYSLVEQLSAEPLEEIVPTAPPGQISEIQEDHFFEELMAQVQRDQPPIASGTFDADGGGLLEGACNPSSTFESWIDSYYYE